MQNGLMVQGGFGPGRQVTDDCDIVDDLPELLQVTALIPNRTSTTTARPLERCHENNGWRTGVSGLASYTIPKIDVLVSGTFRISREPRSTRTSSTTRRRVNDTRTGVHRRSGRPRLQSASGR